jgi:hypothetical protein
VFSRYSKNQAESHGGRDAQRWSEVWASRWMPVAGSQNPSPVARKDDDALVPLRATLAGVRGLLLQLDDDIDALRERVSRAKQADE